MKKMLAVFSIVLLSVGSCKKDSSPLLNYYEVGVEGGSSNWRDSSFVVATSNAALIQAIEAELKLPVDQRKLVIGKLIYGNGGYNINSSHHFKWRFKEDDWNLAEITVEIYDGLPYTDVDMNLKYWVDTVQRFAPWSSYIKKRINKKDNK